MPTRYRLSCPKCGQEFEVNYSPWSSLTGPGIPGLIFREGIHDFSCKCPGCGKRAHDHVTDADEILG